MKYWMYPVAPVDVMELSEGNNVLLSKLISFVFVPLRNSEISLSVADVQFFILGLVEEAINQFHCQRQWVLVFHSDGVPFLAIKVWLDMTIFLDGEQNRGGSGRCGSVDCCAG